MCCRVQLHCGREGCRGASVWVVWVETETQEEENRSGDEGGGGWGRTWGGGGEGRERTGLSRL